METVAGSVTLPKDAPNLTDKAPLPVPTFAFNVTMPVAAFPPASEEGVIVRTVTVNGVSVNVVDTAIPPYFAVIVTEVTDFTR